MSTIDILMPMITPRNVFAGFLWVSIMFAVYNTHGIFYGEDTKRYALQTVVALLWALLIAAFMVASIKGI